VSDLFGCGSSALGRWDKTASVAPIFFWEITKEDRRCERHHALSERQRVMPFYFTSHSGIPVLQNKKISV
jgi:hypothetical protein